MVARAAGEPSAKRAKVDEEEDPLVRRKEELVVAAKEASAKGKGNARAKEELLTLCADFEAKNEKLLRRLPPELWQKILDENVQQNDLLALAMTCRFFRKKLKDLGKKMETGLAPRHLVGKMASHFGLGWFQWVCDTFKVLPGEQRHYARQYWKYGIRETKAAVYESVLLKCSALQGSVEILRWLVEEKGFELNLETTSVESIGLWAGMGGSVEVLKYLSDRGNGFNTRACAGAAEGGHLGALQYLRGLDPPCPWDIDTCKWAAWGGHLDILKWARSEDPPCPWDVWTCAAAAEGGHLEVLQWLRAQDPPCPWGLSTCSFSARGGHLEVLKFARGQDPPCRWDRDMCRELASQNGHEHVIEWIDQQPLIDPRERHWAAIDVTLGDEHLRVV
ncbi:putative ankyrin repeat protein [Chloropicon roscoffensis]|uniref:Ankyrin repeat protein n=1 Tax=Chloropicon roscoffensis TaxID=1461544 RepID=A0AAX4PJA2_9CHLO